MTKEIETKQEAKGRKMEKGVIYSLAGTREIFPITKKIEHFEIEQILFPVKYAAKEYFNDSETIHPMIRELEGIQHVEANNYQRYTHQLYAKEVQGRMIGYEISQNEMTEEERNEYLRYRGNCVAEHAKRLDFSKPIIIASLGFPQIEMDASQGPFAVLEKGMIRILPIFRYPSGSEYNTYSLCPIGEDQLNEKNCTKLIRHNVATLIGEEEIEHDQVVNGEVFAVAMAMSASQANGLYWLDKNLNTPSGKWNSDPIISTPVNKMLTREKEFIEGIKEKIEPDCRSMIDEITKGTAFSPKDRLGEFRTIKIPKIEKAEGVKQLIF